MFYSHNTVSKLSDCYAGTNVAHFLACSPCERGCHCRVGVTPTSSSLHLDGVFLDSPYLLSWPACPQSWLVVTPVTAMCAHYLPKNI